MTMIRDWQGMRSMCDRLLKERTGVDLDGWIQRMGRESLNDEKVLRSWLGERGVTGFTQSYLVMERFGYAEMPVATADELIDGQYADRSQLRPILDAILEAAADLGGATLQARRTHVLITSPRRTFARVQATTPDRVDLCLRLEGLKPEGRLQTSTLDVTLPL